MGRLSQLFWYLNAETHPTLLEKKHHYSHLEITEHLKKLRREYRRRLRVEEEEQGRLWPTRT